MLKTTVDILNALLPFFYAGLLYFYGRVFWDPQSRESRWIRPALFVVIMLHALEIGLRAVLISFLPLANIPQIASVLALAILVIYAYIEIRIQQPTTGVFVLVTVFLLQVFSSSFMVVDAEVPQILQSPLFLVHSGSAMLGYAGFFIAAIYGLMFLLLFRQVKKAQFGKLYQRLPDLEQLGEMTFRAISAGFVMLTIAILVGIILRKNLDPFGAHFDPKVITIYAIWVLYGVLSIAGIIGKRQGRLLPIGAVSGFLLLLLSLLWINLFSGSFHRFY